MHESTLLRRAQENDLSAMEELYEAHRVKAYRVACIIVRDEQAAEDMVQESFIRAFREIHRCDPERPFAPWLTRILINLCRTTLQRHRRVVPITATDSTAEQDPGYGAAETRADIWQALQRLAPEFQETLMLRYYSDFTEPEIAEVLGIPLGTVKSRLHLGRQKMRRLLGQWQSTSQAAGREGSE